MSLIGRALHEVRSFTAFRLQSDFFGDWGGTSTSSGEEVSQSTAMTISAVYSAVSFISDTIATLPIDVVQRYGDGSRYQRAKPDWMIMPNPVTGMDWTMFCQQVLVSLLLDGNAFVGIVRKPRSLEPAQLWVLDPTLVTIDQDANTGVLTYRLNDGYGSPGKILPRRDLVHIRGLTMPGKVRGVSPVERARQSLGGILAAQRFSNRIFANMATPGTVITLGKGLAGEQGEEEAKRVAERFDARHKGADRAFKTVVFGAGTELKTVSLTPEQVQMIETMKYGVLDVARWYRIMPYLLDPTVTSTWGSGIAEQNIQTKQYTLGPWSARIQNALGDLLYDTYLDRAYVARLDFRGFLKGDPEKQARYLWMKMQAGALNADEWRSLDDENPLPSGQGQAYKTSVQFQPVDNQGGAA